MDAPYFTMSWTNPINGTPHPTSHWEIHHMETDWLHDDDQQAQTTVTFWGWHTKTQRDSQLAKVWEKSYTLSADVVNGAPTVSQAILGLYAAAQVIPEPDAQPAFFSTASLTDPN